MCFCWTSEDVCMFTSSGLLESIYLNRFILRNFDDCPLPTTHPALLSFASSVLCLTVQVIKRYVNGYWIQYWSLRDAVNLLPAGFLIADHNPLSPAAQIFFHPTYCLLFFSVDISLILLKDILEDVIWCFHPNGEAIQCCLTPPP